MQLKDIVSQLAPFFKEYGFKRKGSSFYKIENHIVFECVFYRISSPVACYVIHPLYIPESSFSSLDLGERLSDGYLSPGAYASVFNLTEKNECDVWMEEVKNCYKNMVFPIFEKVSSPQKLIDAYKNGSIPNMRNWGGLCKFFSYNAQAYTNFYLRDDRAMKKNVKMGLLVAERDLKGVLAENIRQQWIADLEILLEKAKLPKQERVKFVNDCINFTLEHCLKTETVEPYV